MRRKCEDSPKKKRRKIVESIKEVRRKNGRKTVRGIVILKMVSPAGQEEKH